MKIQKSDVDYVFSIYYTPLILKIIMNWLMFNHDNNLQNTIYYINIVIQSSLLYIQLISTLNIF